MIVRAPSPLISFFFHHTQSSEASNGNAGGEGAGGFSRGLRPEVEAALPEAMEAFHLYASAEGLLPASRLGTVLRAIGQSPTNASIQALVEGLPRDTLDQNAFQEVLQAHYKQPTSVEALVEAFRAFDKEGNGFISASELRDCVTTLSETLSPEEADALLAEADPEGDGQVDYRRWCRSLPLFSLFFLVTPFLYLDRSLP